MQRLFWFLLVLEYFIMLNINQACVKPQCQHSKKFNVVPKQLEIIHDLR